MRNALLFSTMIIMLFGGCKKQAPAIENLPTETDLTACSLTTNCSFLYADNAGMDGIKLNLTTGQYRVFWAHTSIDYAAFSLYMMAPMIGNSFTLTKEDMLAGRVKYQNNCPTCYSSVMLPVDGKIIGRRIAAKDGLPERWLVQADLVLQAGGVSAGAQTIHLKQYYLPAN